MSMIASSRERRRSACPLSRRSLGRIVPSDATTESRPAIRGNRKNEIASFPAFKPKKLAISNLAPLQKSTPAQWLGRLFTADYFGSPVSGSSDLRAGWSRRRNPPSCRFITADHDPPYALAGIEMTEKFLIK